MLPTVGRIPTVGRRGKTVLSISVERFTLTEDQHLTLADCRRFAPCDIRNCSRHAGPYGVSADRNDSGGEVASYKVRRGCAAAARPVVTLGGGLAARV